MILWVRNRDWVQGGGSSNFNWAHSCGVAAALLGNRKPL